MVRQLADEQAGRLRQVAVFGDDMGDLPAFEAVGHLGTPAAPVAAVRVAVVDRESPAAVAEAADLSVPGAAGAVSVLRDVADVARSTGAAGARGRRPPPTDRPTSRPRCATGTDARSDAARRARSSAGMVRAAWSCVGRSRTRRRG